MEPDIILEGFQQAETGHGVGYTRFIGDGVSSVYSMLVQNVTCQGRHIKKLECANHASKCYWSAHEKLKQEKTLYKGKCGLTQRMRQQLTSAAQCAIKMRSKEADVSKAVKLLERDLRNGPYYCFGHHANCSSDFCLIAKERAEGASISHTDTAAPESTDDIHSSSDDNLGGKCLSSRSYCPVQEGKKGILTKFKQSLRAPRRDYGKKLSTMTQQQKTIPVGKRESTGTKPRAHT